MNPSQIVAVNHVELEGPRGTEPELVWLYRDIVGLTLVGDYGGEASVLRFRSGNIELRYRIVENPNLEAVACRLVVEVAWLRTVEDTLRDKGIEVERLRGLDYTDRRLSLLDPAGNRIEIKRQWAWSF